ncbi:MAG: rhomboid family intramembrane serine protease [Rhodothermaceae bacterium]
MEEKTTLKASLKISMVLLSIMWILKLAEILFNHKFSYLGILPREVSGIKGILFSPFLHGDLNHLISNTFPFLILNTSLFYFYRKNSVQIFIFSQVLAGILLWIFGRESYHIGASGLIYSFAAFFFFNGIFYRNIKAITLSLVTIFLYGGLAAGLLPVDEKISWEGHLFGAVSGLLSVFFFSNNTPSKKYDWEDEDISHLPDPEISYKKGYPFE